MFVFIFYIQWIENIHSEIYLFNDIYLIIIFNYIYLYCIILIIFIYI